MNRNSDGVGYESGLTGQIFLFEFLELVEVTAGAQRRVHLVRVVEQAVVDGVLARVLARRTRKSIKRTTSRPRHVPSALAEFSLIFA